MVASPINKNCSRCNAQLKHGFKTLKIEIDNIRSNLMPFSFLKIIASVNFNKIQKVFLLKNFLHRRSMNIASAQHLQQQQQQSQRNNHNNSYIRDLGCKTFLHRRSMNVWTEPLCLNLLGPGNGHVTYLSRFHEPIPKNSL